MRSAVPSPRPEVAALPSYRPGRSATVVAEATAHACVAALAANEQPWGPLPSVLAAVAEAARRGNRYPDTRARALRAALGERLGVGGARVAVGPGSVGLLRQLFVAYAGPGVEVAFPWPSFEAYPIDAQLVGADAVRVPLRRFTVDVDHLIEALTERTRLVVVATPNNPTGTAVRRNELVRLADAVPDDCLLVVDEAYHEFVTGADVPDAVSLLGDRPNVAVLRTFSKAYGLAAFRIGYLVAAPEVVDAVDKVAVPFATSALSQAAAAAAWRDDDGMHRRVAELVAERAGVVRALRALGLPVPDPQGNFVWLPAGAAATELSEQLERLGVATRPFAEVGVRVAIGTPEQNDAFLAALAEVAQQRDLASAWGLPTGETAALAAGWLDRLDAVERRLTAHAERGVPSGLTGPDPASGERWDGRQVWAHLAEFGRYWLAELDAVLDAPGDGAVPFGRVKSDPARIAAIEADRRGVHEQLRDVVAAIDALRARLAELGEGDWRRVGRHSTLGDLDVDAQLRHFHVGHYEEHAAQLDSLGSGPR